METNKEVKKIYTPYELFYDEGLSKTGWAGLLLPLYDEVEKWNKDKDENSKFRFSQIKEKWSTLQLYNFGATDEQWKRIRMCEMASGHICMLCGSPFKIGKTRMGWMTTMCEECASKNSKTYSPTDKFFVFKKNGLNDDVRYILAKSKKEAVKKLSETHNLSTSEYKLIDQYKAEDWKLLYDSIRITPIIKIALKLQSFGFKLKERKDKIKSFFWIYKGYIKFIIYHYLLRNDKMDKTIHNFLKY